MRKSLLLFLLLVALSAGLLAGACAAVQGRRETVSYRTEPLAGDPTAADGVELTWVSTCGYHLFWHSTFPAAAPEEAETRFSYSGQEPSWITELDEDVLELSHGLNFLDIAPDSPSAGLRALWAELSAQTSPLPGDETYTEHNGLISIKREIQLADYLTDFPLSVDRLVYTAWAADREFGTSQYDTSINAEELTRRFRAYFPIPVPEGLAMEISMTPDASGQLLSACFLTLDSSLLTLQADCVSTGEGVLFALCAGGSMAKALGSGVPIGAVCARGDAAKTLTPGTHGSTFAGGPLACGLAEATLDTMINGGVMENAVKVGEYFRAELRKLQEKHSIITEVRGMGMINGAELANNEIGPQIVNKCFEKKVLINCTAGNVLRFIPPLIATEAEIDVVVKALDEAMTELGV